MRNDKGQFAEGGRHHLKHGLSKAPIYNVYRAMRSRCENPKVAAYKDYGGRGITVCERWQVFENFYADMGDAPKGCSLDRIDNDRGYSPDNCRWASRVEQARNKRGLHLLTVGEQTRSLGEWAELTGLNLATLWARLDKGWSGEKAISTPVRVSRRWHGAKHGVEWTDPETRRERKAA